MYLIPIDENEVRIIETVKPFLPYNNQKIIEKVLTFINIFDNSKGRVLNENALSRFLAMLEGETQGEETMTVKVESKARQIVDLVEAILAYTNTIKDLHGKKETVKQNHKDMNEKNDLDNKDLDEGNEILKENKYFEDDQ